MEWRPGVARPMAVFGQHSILRYLIEDMPSIIIFSIFPVLQVRATFGRRMFDPLSVFRPYFHQMWRYTWSSQDFFFIKIGFIKLYSISWPPLMQKIILKLKKISPCWKIDTAVHRTRQWVDITSYRNVPVMIVTLSILSSRFKFYVWLRKV